MRVTDVVDNQVHDGLWHNVLHRLVDNRQVRRHQRPDGLHLTLKKWIRLRNVITFLQARFTIFTNSYCIYDNENGY